jgi:aminoglycoside 3-N-acetyltransferase
MLGSKWIKTLARTVDGAIRSTSPAALTHALRRMGIQPGDTVLVHSSFDGMRYFEGTPQDAIHAFRDLVGPQGTLLMPAFSFVGRSYDYLSSNPTFDLRRTPARTGLICELFRRQPDVIRSLHPTHSVIAAGPLARSIVDDHQNSVTPFDEHSPWRYLKDLNAWAVCVGTDPVQVPLTPYHYFDELLTDRLGIHNYYEPPFEVTVHDGGGRETRVAAYAHDPQTGSRRRYDRLAQCQIETGSLKFARAGAIKLWAGRVQTLYESACELARRGITAYD